MDEINHTRIGAAVAELTGSPRDKAVLLLQHALKVGIRGANKDAVLHAIDVLEDNGRRGVTDLNYRNLRSGKHLPDPERPGLLMRANKSGKVWLYRFDHPETHRQTELRFGHYPDLGLTEARIEWEHLRAQRLRGEVPTMAEGAVDRDPTVRELARRYLSDYAEKVKRSWRDDQRLLEREVLPKYGDLPVSDFGPDEVSAILLCIKMRGADREAEKVRAVLSTLFNVARGRTRKISFLDGAWIAPDFPNPVDGVNLEDRETEEYTAKQSEIAALVRNLPVVPMRDEYKEILLLQAQTCSRISEVTGMRWGEIDGDAWLLPSERAKNKEPHKVMLPRQSVALLERRRTMAGVSAFVFPSQRDMSRPMRSDLVINALAANREALGVGDKFTSHKIRHQCLTWLAENGVGKEIRDRISNHKPPVSADRIYVSASRDAPARMWLQKWSDHLQALAVGNVVPMERRNG